jgi:hypothetical protein
VVLSVLVRFPFSKRLWALPVLVTLYHNEKDDLLHGRKHKTPVQLLRQMSCVLLHWFPKRCFVLTGDGNFAAHDLAVFCSQRRGRLTLVSRFYKNAQLYELPPEPVLNAFGKRVDGGRPRKKGAKMDTPEQVVQKAKRRTRLNVSWYGGGRRNVSVVTGAGHWYQAGQGLVLVSWVHVRDLTGTHEDGYFMTTDIAMTAQEIIETYTARWNLETTFEEMRSYAGLETTRGWKENTVLRVAPCLFGMYTLVACLYSRLPRRYRRERAADWPGKTDVTFADAITAVRRWLWVEWVFSIPGYKPVFEKLSRPFRSLLLAALAPAA